MVSGQIESLSGLTLVIAKMRAFIELLKVRLSLLVAFSCAFGYGLATQGRMDWAMLSMITLGGFLLSGASVTINQIIEKDLDKLMNRTMNRPLPTERLTIQEAMIFAVICMIVSVGLDRKSVV